MSEHSHIDKIFKDGLGEKDFSNVDAMWERMEAELDKNTKKRRPFVFLLASAVLLTGAWLGVQYFAIAPDNDTVKHIAASSANTVNSDVHEVVTMQQSTQALVSTSPVKEQPKTGIAKTAVHTPVAIGNYKMPASTRISTVKAATTVENALYDDGAVNAGTVAVPQSQEFAGTGFERMTADAPPVLLQKPGFKTISILPVENKRNDAVSPNAVAKREEKKSAKYTLETIAGGDLIRLNRKAGFYTGLRLNKHLKKGSLISVGVNYASHTVLDRYRVANKPLDRGWYDAVINRMNSVRIPVFLQHQMPNNKFALMIGLVPTYITSAEVYNVPDSYIGNPDPYRKFTLKDLNRFNLLFGAGLKYTPAEEGPFSRLSFELNGSYSFTGVVKDGYKNWSRVNDNFKSIQLGVAFRLN